MRLEDIAYTAGVIDGEGYIGCTKNKEYEYNFTLRLEVHTKYDKMPNWLQSKWGGTVLKRKDNSYRWRVGKDDGVKILTAILPFMVEKPRQAEIYLEIASLTCKKNQFFKEDMHEVLRKENLYQELRSLHN